jgi:two-component system chemotaxis response regulator CheB
MTPLPIEAVVIGSSAGAIDALSAILPALPKSFRVPILVVVHVPAGRDCRIVEIFRDRCVMDVCEAEDKMPIRPGGVYFAPADYHLLVEEDRRLSLSSDEPVHFSRPSIDVLFESAADAYEERLLGIILSGANNDGAQGLRRVAERGGRTLVQEPNEAVAGAMPQAAIQACPAARVMRIDEMKKYLQILNDTP